MATLENTKIKDTYDGLLKTIDNAPISGEVEITDGEGTATGVHISNNGDLKADNDVTVGGDIDLSGDLTYEGTGNFDILYGTNVVLRTTSDGGFTIGDVSLVASASVITSDGQSVQIKPQNNTRLQLEPFGSNFIQLGDATANRLDDYEEGTFTPTVGSYIGGSLTPVYNTQSGSYTKIGNVCIAKFNLVLDQTSTFSGNGTLIFGGLPFTISTDASVQCSVSSFARIQNFEFFVGAKQSPGGNTTISLSRQATPSGFDREVGFTTFDLETGGDISINFSLTYKTT